MPIAAICPPMAAYASPWAGVVPASPACATQAPGSGRAHRTRPADWQARLVQGRAAEAGPGTTASATRIAMNEPRRSHSASRPRPAQRQASGTRLSDSGRSDQPQRIQAAATGRHVNVSHRASKVSRDAA